MAAGFIGFIMEIAVSGSAMLLTLVKHRLHLHVCCWRKKENDGDDSDAFLHCSTPPCPSTSGKVRSCRQKKKVRFAPDVAEPSSDGKQYRRRHASSPARGGPFNNNYCYCYFYDVATKSAPYSYHTSANEFLIRPCQREIGCGGDVECYKLQALDNSYTPP